jgi:hypothetical protein
MTTPATSPYLSVVAVSRNDDHGGDPLRRTQIFINALAWQADHYALPTELVLVDWNPPENKAGLADVLRFPVNAYFSPRVIVIPPQVHAGFRHGDRLPLFQMIGKNVGIRRARGEFIVATNIDILFDDALFEVVAHRKLDPNRMYRADRFDVANALPDDDHAAQQAFCRNPANLIRRNQRLNPPAYSHAQNQDVYNSAGVLDPKFTAAMDWASLERRDEVPFVTLKAETSIDLLSTNACGDFTLLHKDAWAALSGYGEFESYSMHIDSIGCVAAHLRGFLETSFLPPMVCYHIEHAPGSGWTPESGGQLFARICTAGIPLFDWGIMRKTLLAALEQNPSLELNDTRWGLHDMQLPETTFTGAGKELLPGDIVARHFTPLAAVKQQYEPGILFQSSYFNSNDSNQRTDAAYAYFRHLTSRPYWRIVQTQITMGRMVKRCLHAVMPSKE